MSSILVVDDDPDVLTTVCFVLESAGHEAHPCADPRAAVSAAALKAVDGVVLDVLLPEMNGWEVLAALRASPHGQRLPVLMLSAIGDTGNRAKGLRLGADDFLAKPFDPEELIARVDSLLRRTRPESPRGLRFAGDLEQHAAAEVMQVLVSLRKVGRLELEAPQGVGFVDLAPGGWVAAGFGALRERAALSAVLGLRSGSFRFLPSTAQSGNGQGGRPLEPFLLEAAWIEDELARRPALDPAQVLEATGVPPPADDYEDLPWKGVLEALHDQGRARVAELLAGGFDSPARIQLAIARLVESGAVAAATGAAQAGPARSRGPAAAGRTERRAPASRSEEAHGELLLLCEDSGWSLLRWLVIGVPDAWLGAEARQRKQRVLLRREDELSLAIPGGGVDLRFHRFEMRLPGQLPRMPEIGTAAAVVAWGVADPSLLRAVETRAPEAATLFAVGAASRLEPPSRWLTAETTPGSLEELLRLVGLADGARPGD